MLWLALAVVYGVRRPGGALLAGFSAVAGAAILQGVGSLLPGTVTKELIGSAFFLPILSGMGAIVLAQEPDGILALAGWRNRDRSRARSSATSTTAEAAMHGGEVPDHERAHLGEPALGAERRRRGAVVARDRRGLPRRRGGPRRRSRSPARPGRRAARAPTGPGSRRCAPSRPDCSSRPRDGAASHGEDVTSWPAYRRARRGRAAGPRGPGHLPGTDGGREPRRLPSRGRGPRAGL